MGRLIKRDATTNVFRLVAWLRLATTRTGDPICRANTPRPVLIEADMVAAEIDHKK